MQIAEEHKAYAQGKDEEVKVLEKSIEELENTVCTLESQVSCVSSFLVLINHSIFFVIILKVYSFSTLILPISPNFLRWTLSRKKQSGKECSEKN